MNFAEVRNIKGQKDESNFPRKLDMFATFTEIQGLSYNTNGTGVVKCKLRDETGETHPVTIYRKEPIPGQMMNQRAQFSIYSYDGNYQNKQYIGYAGLWNDRANVNQPQTPPQSAPQPTNNGRDATGTSIERQATWKGACRVVAAMMQHSDAPGLPEIKEYLAELCVMGHDWIATGQVNFNQTDAPFPDDEPSF